MPISFDIRRKARSRRVRVTGFVRRSRTRRRIQNDGKWPCVPHTDTILHLQLNPRHAVDAVTRHILLSQRPGRFNRLLQVAEEERRVGPEMVVQVRVTIMRLSCPYRSGLRQVNYCLRLKPRGSTLAWGQDRQNLSTLIMPRFEIVKVPFGTRPRQ